MQRDLSGLGLSYIHKLSVLRLAVDLIKADNQIFGEEVEVLTHLQQQFGLTQQDIDGIHYITLQQAVDSLKDLEVEAAEMIVDLLNDIMCVDNDIDYDENILLTSVKMSIARNSKSWCNVISATNVMDETSQKQIMYLEDAPSEAAHKVFDDKYDRLLITKAFNDLGLDFFYLPDAIGGMNPSAGLGTKDNAALLRQAMKYLVPSAVASSESSQETFNPYDFFHFLMSRYNVSADALKSHSFLMLKIRDSYYLDDDNNLARSVDFFVMDISQEVKKRIYSFVSNFDKKSNQISYEGCYKILCDYLSTESKNVSHVILDAKYDFRLKDSARTPVVFESSPQARTFYLLLLWYGENGVSQSLFEEALSRIGQIDRNDYLCAETGMFDMNRYMGMLQSEKTDVARLIYNTILIYSAISTKDAENVKFLDYISKIFHYRSALKHYVNKGFADVGKLSDPAAFSVMFDAQLKVYRLPAKVSRFVVETSTGTVDLTAGDLWKSLI
jgi:hypothetical protein